MQSFRQVFATIIRALICRTYLDLPGSGGKTYGKTAVISSYRRSSRTIKIESVKDPILSARYLTVPHNCVKGTYSPTKGCVKIQDTIGQWYSKIVVPKSPVK